MPAIISSISTQSPSFIEQKKEFLDVISNIRELEEAVVKHSERARGKFQRRKQLMPRERISLLLDPGTPFLELSTLAGYKMHDDDGGKHIAGGGNIIGIGYVKGVRWKSYADLIPS